jgi:hypothetical protein
MGDNLDLIVEGEVERAGDEATLRRVTDVYDAEYGWPLTIRSDVHSMPHMARGSEHAPLHHYDRPR